MMAWVNSAIGKPYLAGASGPDAYDCIGLLRDYFRTQFGRELPDYALEDPGEASFAEFVRATTLRVVNGPPQHGDVMTMESAEGKHVGIVVRSSEGLGVLHAIGRGDRGIVCWQPLEALVTFKGKRLWRA